MCRACNRPVGECVCGKRKAAPKGDGTVRVARETKGRKGKCVSVITGLPLHPEGIEELAKSLKQRCGAGGAVKDGAIEIQGDHRDVLVEALREQGYEAKCSGG